MQHRLIYLILLISISSCNQPDPYSYKPKQSSSQPEWINNQKTVPAPTTIVEPKIETITVPRMYDEYESYIDSWQYSEKAGLAFYDSQNRSWIYQNRKVNYLTDALISALELPLKELATELQERKDIKDIKEDELIIITAKHIKPTLDAVLSRVTEKDINIANNNTTQEETLALAKIKLLNDFVIQFLKFDYNKLKEIDAIANKETDKQVELRNKSDKIHTGISFKKDAAALLNIITKKEAVCEGYAVFFQLLCKVANMPDVVCQIVGGPVKLAQKEIGRVWHAWNAVRVGGKWYLLDPTWDGLGEYNTDFLFADPKAFIHSHLAKEFENKETGLNLLKQKISIKLFKILPLPYPRFFKLGLKVAKLSIVEKNANEHSLKIINPNRVKLFLAVVRDNHSIDFPEPTVDETNNAYSFTVKGKFESIFLSAYTEECHDNKCPPLLDYQWNE